MLGHQLYPTPKHLIEKMRDKVKRPRTRRAAYLDPNAGTGAILDYLRHECHVPLANLYAIEIDGQLQAMLAGKGYKIIESDFMDYDGRYRFDAILMNPPFSDGVKHLMKAWEILAPGGTCVCILPVTAVEGRTSQQKLLARTIEKYGEVEDIGQPFLHAERPTPVRCVMVTLHKPEIATSATNMPEMEIDPLSAEATFESHVPATSDMTQALVDQYEAARRALLEREEAQAKLDYYTAGLKSAAGASTKPMALTTDEINEELDALKEKFWTALFERTKVGKRATSGFREEFEQYQKQVDSMAFSRRNVEAAVSHVIQNYNEMMIRCVHDVFDLVTSLNKKNRVHVEGWATNRSYKLNRKMIIPNVVSDSYGSLSLSYSSRRYEDIDDIDRATCFVAGVKYDELETTAIGAIQNRLNLIRDMGVDYREPFESTFFIIRIFKKGTAHLTFKDGDLCDRFNAMAAQGRGWRVGGDY